MLQKFFCIFLLFPFLAFSHSEPTGTSLVRMFWNDVRERRIHKLDSYISSDFQVLSETGIMRKKQQLEAFESFPITRFTLRDVRTTRTSHRIIVSYIIRIFNGSSSSLFREIRTWVKREGHWKLVSGTFIAL